MYFFYFNKFFRRFLFFLIRVIVTEKHIFIKKNYKKVM